MERFTPGSTNVDNNPHRNYFFQPDRPVDGTTVFIRSEPTAEAVDEELILQGPAHQIHFFPPERPVDGTLHILPPEAVGAYPQPSSPLLGDSVTIEEV